MSIKPILFESSRVKEASRQETREARERVLSRAKEDYDKKQMRKEEAKKRGDDKWMLPSLNERLKAESSKKNKKHKKKKKKHKKKTKSSSSDSSSEDEWVEKDAPSSKSSHAEKQEKVVDEHIVKDIKAERDEWMSLPGLFPCTTRDQVRQQKKPSAKQEAEEEKKFMLDRPGQSERELNPFWKDGGSGLPQTAGSNEEEEKDAPAPDLHLPVKAVGDQGVGWLRKALQRVHEQAAETGRSVEDVAAECWGSLEKLQSLLSEAEDRRRQPQRRNQPFNSGSSKDHRGSYRDSRSRNLYSNEREYDDKSGSQHSSERSYEGQSSSKKKFRKPIDDFDMKRDKHKEKFKKPVVDDYESQRRNDVQSYSGRSKRDGGISNQISLQHTSEDYTRNKSTDDRARHRNMTPEKERFQKPVDDYDSGRRDGRSTESSSSRFQKPPEDDDYEYRKRPQTSRGPTSKNWQKRDTKKELESSPASSSRRSRRSPSPLSSSNTEEEEPVQESMQLLSDKEMNEMGAKIVKAEIMGNEALAQQLKLKLEESRKARESAKTTAASGGGSSHEEVVILTRTDSRGFTRPLEAPQHAEPSGGRRKKQKVQTHDEGQRIRYFPDDDKYTLQDMFTREKLNTVEDSNHEFAKLAAKGKTSKGGEYDMDELFEERACLKESAGKTQARDKNQAIHEHQRQSRALDGCRWCIDNKQMLKHLIIAIGSKVYLSLPPYQSLTEGHCLLSPMHHAPCGTLLDEDVWSEMMTFRKTLTKMFLSKDMDLIFFETARNLRGFPHMVLECVPMDRETGDMAPIYFKKAIQECEMEWSTNKKLVELAGKGVRRAIPKGLPYFSVDFGNDDGFGHVIEDEKHFPPNFAQEIIGGMLDLDHHLWRKRHNENFEAQRKKVLEFAKDWAPHDFTQEKKSQNSSTSSDSD